LDLGVGVPEKRIENVLISIEQISFSIVRICIEELRINRGRKN